jgi:hypothetical protein
MFTLNIKLDNTLFFLLEFDYCLWVLNIDSVLYKLRSVSPQAKYTDRATAPGWRS